MSIADSHPRMWAADLYLRVWAANMLLCMWIRKMDPMVWIPNLHPKRVRRAYRRFRYRNQYDSPILVFFCDTLISLIAPIVVTVSFFFGYRYFF